MNYNKNRLSFLFVIGYILLILAIILYFFKVSSIIIYSIFTLGVVSAIAHKIYTIMLKHKEQESIVKDVPIIVLYIVLIALMWTL